MCTAPVWNVEPLIEGTLAMIIPSIEGISRNGRKTPDAELLGDICAEREGALEVLFRRYGGLVCRVASGILRDRAEAEDVTQEVFLEIYRKASQYDPARGSVKVWLLQYTYRRTLRRKATLRRRAAYGAEPIETVEERVHDHRRRLTPEESRWILRAALAQLPERQRATLELTTFEDLTLRDVAERLGVSFGCTRHYYYRGLARLQRWARVIDRREPAESRAALRGGTTGVERDREPRRLARI
jgi:RNA polymerase sigma-70 factor, ECF subfamily